MKVFSAEEFAARRRKAQTDLENELRPHVEEALSDTDTHGWAELLGAVEHVYSVAYRDEGGDHSDTPPREFINDLEEALGETSGDEHTADRITVWLATAVLSQATIRAAADDPEELFLEWVDMDDESVRAEHRSTAGQQVPVGEPFDVDGVEMPYPGWPGAPIELWINCRCTVRPVLASEVSTEFREVSPAERKRDAGAGRAMPDGSYPIDNCSDLKNAIQAIGRAKDPGKVKAHIKRRKSSLGCPDVSIPEGWSLTAAGNSGSCVVALPAAEDGINAFGDEQKHVTILYVGEIDDELAEELKADVAALADTIEPFNADVSGYGVLGPDKAKVLFVESHDFNAVRGALEQDENVATALRAFDSHPHFVPHVTLTYDEPPDGTDDVAQITFDRLAVWHRDEQTEYELRSAGMDENTEAPTSASEIRVPWHGILAPEGVASGDGRRFLPGSLSTRDLPLPLTWQKQSSEGHQGNVTVATIEEVEMVDGLMRASGYFLQTAEADEVTGLIAEFGRFGVSVDADQTTAELDDEAEEVVFSEARVCSACIVPIPAFAEAWVALGLWEDDTETEPTAPEVDEELVAAVDAAGGLESFVRKGYYETDGRVEFIDVAPGRTEDGPGWLTHPVDTDRLRDYWVRGPGAAKIAWGTPGDFNRCRALTAEYVKPQYLAGYCANRHYDALGTWPGRHGAASDSLEHTAPGESISLVASVSHKAPAAWFKNPEFTQGDERLFQDKDGNWGCPITVTDEGQVYGHAATWGACHLAFPNECKTAPHSLTGYAEYLTGYVDLDNGEAIPVGNITIGGGHAGPRARLRAAKEHYDSTSTVVADVTCGEDEFGIWLAGWIRPGASKDMVTALKASAISGDWRKHGVGQELIAAHAVNVPGFGIPRVRMATDVDGQVSLVAAGVVPPNPKARPSEYEMERIADSLAASVAVILEERAARRQKMAALAARLGGQ